MCFSDLERAVDLRSKELDDTQKKRPRDDAFHQIQLESSFLLLNHTRARSDHHNHRTGRWSNDEVALVDALVAAFDCGALAIPYGLKLNDFLGDMLLCKSSRLTKKMKNAKLSTRSYTLGQPSGGHANSEVCSTVASLQEKFLLSLTSEPVQLELRFNMLKLWRTHFSNLCLQVGYELLDARRWLSSLEDMEARAADAEDHIRKARRRRLGSALSNDVGSLASTGVFIGGRPAKEISQLTAMTVTKAFNGPSSLTIISEQSMDARKIDNMDEMELLVNVLGDSMRSRSGSLEWHDLEDCSLGEQLGHVLPQMNDVTETLGDCGPFLDQIINYMEAEKGPFEHVDLWAPSSVDEEGPSKQGDAIRLYNAGHATRSDINSTLAFQLHEYGIYSTNFSFAPGVGLPGRVFTNGEPSWETKVNEEDPFIFERAGGAKVYGVKTALGIPLESPEVGRMILALYSTKEIAADPKLIKKYVSAFSKWIPDPKWHLVIGLGIDSNHSSASDGTVSAVQALLTTIPHASHPPLTKPPAALVKQEMAANQNRHTPPLVPKSEQSEKEWTVQTTRPMVYGGQDDEEQQIASLLGQHMPISDHPSPGGVGPSLLSHFITLRLLLLRSSDRRSSTEQELLKTLVKSFRGYSKDNRRSGSELAVLLAKDWMFLAAAYMPVTPSPTQSLPRQTILEQHQCHTLTVNNPMSATGRLPFAPPLLGNSFSSTNSMDASSRMMNHYHHNIQHRERRVSDAEAPQANLVEEL